MLFNSYEFIFLLLPVSVIIYYILNNKFNNVEASISWLVISSLFFYGWWNPKYLFLLSGSILLNYFIGKALYSSSKKNQQIILFLGISLNLISIGYFKYFNFFIDSVNHLTNTSFTIETILLPLAISFFTFQQIAYLVDAYKGITHEYKFTHYVLFVSFFPQLIAGPIVHHKEMLSQFIIKQDNKQIINNIVIGVVIFSFGLFKKAVLADGIAPYATPIFLAAEHGEILTFFQAWGGALAYTMQLYFDFSGYSDMAIGAACLFGIKLPLNFYSPYKSLNIIEFWRRWHITLSRFLRDYLYIPLGGNRKGISRRYFNLMLTMLLGGFWHGANYTFIIWGGLHGFYLIINHSWLNIKSNISFIKYIPNKLARLTAWLITFTAVVISWVFFRSADIDTAFKIINAMTGLNGIAIPNAIFVRLGDFTHILTQLGISSYIGGGKVFISTYLWLFFLFFIITIMPNTAQLMKNFNYTIKQYSENKSEMLNNNEKLDLWLTFSLNKRSAILTAIIASVGILALTSVSEFLYFQF